MKSFKKELCCSLKAFEIGSRLAVLRKVVAAQSGSGCTPKPWRKVFQGRVTVSRQCDQMTLLTKL